MNTDTHQAPQLPQTDVKCRFFSQYFGVKVFQNELNKQYNYVKYSYPLTIEKDFNKEIKEFLELKPLSKITDEDAIEIQRITGSNHLPKQPLIYACLKKSDAIPVIDYLRSKGYALPFMEYSVEDLISFGWVRLV
ncbi:hypothetical protein [Flavobacterium sp.]|uniref:hypothetical protein n=1 Tax=Flavobacterium sp. TaxID=239 RepID=UPI0040475971